MDRSGLLKLLAHQVREIDMIIKSMDKSSAIHRIDIDLLLSKIRNFYEESYLLHTIGQESKPNLGFEIIARDREPSPKPPEPQPSPEDTSFDTLNPFLNPLFDTPVTFREVTAAEPSAPPPAPEPLRKEPIKPDPVIPEPEPEAAHPVVQAPPPKPAPSSPLEAPVQAPKDFTPKKSSSVNERPIADLFDAIGLNDRFLYTRELFANSNERFRETLNKLNTAGSYEQALRYFNSAVEADPENPVTQAFLSLIERRYLQS